MLMRLDCVLKITIKNSIQNYYDTDFCKLFWLLLCNKIVIPFNNNNYYANKNSCKAYN